MQRFFGLDIGSYYIKLVELSPNKGGMFELRSYGVIPSPANLAATDDEKDIRKLVEVIQKAVETYKVSSKVVVSLPEGNLYSFVVDFPKMSKKELAKSLEWEAEQYIPMPLDEVSLDYQILEPVKGGGEGRMEVLIIAAPKKFVYKYMKVLERAGLEALSVENQTTAVVRSLATGMTDSPTSLLVSMGASSTDFAIVRSGTVRFTRSVPTGGNVMTRALVEKLGFELNRAEEYKKSHGLQQDQLEGKIRTALEPVVDVLITEMKRSVAFYHSRYQPDSIKKAILFGGTSLIPGLLGYLANHLDLELEMAESTKLIIYPSAMAAKAKEFKRLSPITTVATGLAMKKLS